MATFSPFVGPWMLCRKFGKKFFAQDDPYENCLHSLNGDAPYDQFALNYLGWLTQARHYLTSHVVYQVNSSLANMLFDSTIDVRFSELKVPNCCFEVNFERGYLIPKTKIPMPSFLCYVRGKDTDLSFEEKFNDDLHDRRIIHMLPSNMNYIFGRSLESRTVITTIIPTESISFAEIKKNPQALTKKMDKLWTVNRLSFANDIDGIAQLIQREKAPHAVNHSQIECQTTWVQRWIVNAYLLKILSYMNIENAETLEGADHNRPYAGTTPKILILGKTVEHEEWARLRSGHIRCLRSKRYRRAPDGSCRIIWVREHLVRRDKPYIERDKKAVKIQSLGLQRKDTGSKE